MNWMTAALLFFLLGQHHSPSLGIHRRVALLRRGPCRRFWPADGFFPYSNFIWFPDIWAQTLPTPLCCNAQPNQL